MDIRRVIALLLLVFQYPLLVILIYGSPIAFLCLVFGAPFAGGMMMSALFLFPSTISIIVCLHKFLYKNMLKLTNIAKVVFCLSVACQLLGLFLLYGIWHGFIS